MARKSGNKTERARSRATGTPSLAANRILQYVLIDHTRLDVWAKIVDAEGRTVFVARPLLTLALDLYSRTVVGAIVSFEPPSLDSVMACIRQVVRPKTWLVEKYGELKGSTDVWGKPRWVVVDNGLEFVSPSFQSSLEAAGIDPIWAPVRNPEFKVFVERMFRTLNELVWHRMPGAIPISERELAKLELEIDPPDEAEFTVSEINDIFWEAIATVYHLEVHEGIGMAPARAWTAGKKRKGRPMVNDVRVLDKLFGRVTTATLTVKGIQVDNMRFSDQRKVTGLLGRLLPRAPKRKQGKGLLSSGRVDVTITIYGWTAEYIGVWDPVTNQTIDLPNVHPRYAKGQSWIETIKCKAFADRENLAFHSEEERIAARVALARRLSGRAELMTPTERKIAIRTAATPREAEIRHVEQTTAPSSPDGMEEFGIPVAVAAHETKGNRAPPKAARRGGKRASKVAAETRKASKLASEARKTRKSSVRRDVMAPSDEKGVVLRSQPPLSRPRCMDENQDQVIGVLDKLENDLNWRY